MQKEIKVPCDIYSRVVGFYSKVQGWHPGKKSEWNDRLEYKINEKELKDVRRKI